MNVLTIGATLALASDLLALRGLFREPVRSSTELSALGAVLVVGVLPALFHLAACLGIGYGVVRTTAFVRAGR